LAPVLLVFLGAGARADFFVHHWEDHHTRSEEPDFNAQFLYYSTTSNYDANASQSTPAGFQGLTRYILDAELVYPVLSGLSVFGRASWAAEQLDSSGRGGSAYGFGDQTLGASYRIFEKRRGGEPVMPFAPKATIDLQLQADFPGYSNSSSASKNTPFMGDGSVDGTIGAFVDFPFLTLGSSAALHVVGGVGYTYRSLDFSSALPFTLGLKYASFYGPDILVVGGNERSPGFFASLCGFGVHSMGNDASGGKTTLNNGAGGSALIYSANPSLLSGRIEAGYQTSGKLAFFAAFEQSFWGENAPYGSVISGGIRLDFSRKPATFEPSQHPENPGHMTSVEYGKPNKGFVKYSLEARVDRVNDRLNLVKINRGSQDNVEVGQVFDIFSVKPNGQLGEPIARAKVTAVKADEAALTISEYFKEVLINEGFVAKRLVQ
jgi:hypothetical protein